MDEMEVVADKDPFGFGSSKFGLNPEDRHSIEDGLIDPDCFETFIKGRRSIRQYCDEDLKPD